MLDVGQGLNQSKDLPAWGMGEAGRGDPPAGDLLISLQIGGILFHFQGKLSTHSRYLSRI